MRDRYSLGWFYQEQADHRLVFPKLLFAVDHLAFHAQGKFTLVWSFCLQAITGSILWLLSGSAYPQDKNERLIQGAFVAACVFSSQQWINLVEPFQVQFPMVYCAAAGALFAMRKATEDRAGSPGWLAGGMLLAIVATYSMANGVLIWPVMLLASWWLAMSKGSVTALAAVGALVVTSFFWGWHPALTGMQPTIHDLYQAAVFGLAYLGAPAFAPAKFADSAATSHLEYFRFIPGAVLALLFAGGFAMFLRRRERYNSARAMLVFYGLFLAVSCGSIVAGRSVGPLTEAYQSRYTTPMYLLWISGLLAAWPVVIRWNRLALYGALAISIYVGIVLPQTEVRNLVLHFADLERRSEAAVVDDVADPDIWVAMFQPADLAMDAVDYLKKNRLSIFAEDWSRWPGVPLKSQFIVDPDQSACQGQFYGLSTVASFRPGWILSGQAWDAKARRPPKFVILADDRGMVAGVAPTQTTSDATQGATWIGYVGGQPRPITAYVLEADERSLCSVATRKLPFLETLSVKELGSQLPEAGVGIAGSWNPDGYYKGPGGPGTPALSGRFFGSYPPDAGTGTIRLGPFHLDGSHRMAIPLTSGPDTRGLSVTVLDAATKQALARIDPMPKNTAWWAWDPNLPAGHGLTVEIIGEDKGTGWGQWMALGWPHELKQ